MKHLFKWEDLKTRISLQSSIKFKEDPELPGYVSLDSWPSTMKANDIKDFIIKECNFSMYIYNDDNTLKRIVNKDKTNIK